MSKKRFSPARLIPQRLLARLLHYANTNPPLHRTEFYALKERLLRRYGTFRGHELQEIKKECWGDGWWLANYDNSDGEPVPCGPDCRRCGGTGIFDIRWVRLERWEWCGYVFHRPDGDTRVPPEVGSVRIFGRIQHADYGRLADEAGLWLLLLCGEWRLLWRTLTGSRACGWQWWPLLNVQKVAMSLNMWLRWRRCLCGKWYPTWGSGRQECRKCWNKTVEIPF